MATDKSTKGPAKEPAEESAKESVEFESSRIGRFIQTYHGFLSSFVIGAAGLIATSIWQFRQADIAGRQAAAQQKAAETQADNNWKIEKAKILAQNLQVLSTQGAGNVEQRYGVLLSLTRGNILDSELAVSYALELGKDNPEYMRSVLTNTADKDYWRLARAFEPTCQQRYGVTKPVEICSVNKLADRSAAIAVMFADEVQSAFPQGKLGPVEMLSDEHQVQGQTVRLSWLFAPALTVFYEKRQWNDINRFESSSTGAKLVAALVLAAARTGEMVSTEEAKKLEDFHSQRRKWLTDYLLANTCDADCKSKLVQVMLTSYDEAQGGYDLPMRTLLRQPRSQSASAISALHGRILWCQVDDQDLAQFRDRVLVPQMSEFLSKGDNHSDAVEDLVDLLAVVPAPKDPQALTAWKSLFASMEKGKNAPLMKKHNERRAAALRDRASPPPAMRKINMCGPESPGNATQTATH